MKEYASNDPVMWIFTIIIFSCYFLIKAFDPFDLRMPHFYFLPMAWLIIWAYAFQPVVFGHGTWYSLVLLAMIYMSAIMTQTCFVFTGPNHRVVQAGVELFSLITVAALFYPLEYLVTYQDSFLYAQMLTFPILALLVFLGSRWVRYSSWCYFFC
jgi:hypothetical protein